MGAHSRAGDLSTICSSRVGAYSRGGGCFEGGAIQGFTVSERKFLNLYLLERLKRHPRLNKIKHQIAQDRKLDVSQKNTDHFLLGEIACLNSSDRRWGKKGRCCIDW